MCGCGGGVCHDWGGVSGTLSAPKETPLAASCGAPLMLAIQGPGTAPPGHPCWHPLPSLSRRAAAAPLQLPVPRTHQHRVIIVWGLKSTLGTRRNLCSRAGREPLFSSLRTRVGDRAQRWEGSCAPAFPLLFASILEEKGVRLFPGAVVPLWLCASWGGGEVPRPGGAWRG